MHPPTYSEKKTTSKASTKETINEGIDEEALPNHNPQFIEATESTISQTNLENELTKQFSQNKKMYREFRAKGYNYEELKIDLSLLHEVINTLQGLSSTSESLERLGAEIDSNKLEEIEKPNENLTQEIDRGAVGRAMELTRDILLGAAENLNDFKPKNGIEKHAEYILIESIQKMAAALIKPGMAIHLELRMGTRERDDKSLLESLREALKDIKGAEKYVIEEAKNIKKIEISPTIREVASSILSAAEAIKRVVPEEGFFEHLKLILDKDNEFVSQSSEEFSRKFYNKIYQFGREGLPKMVVQAPKVWRKWLRYEPQSTLKRGYSLLNHWFRTVSDETADADGEIRAEVLPLLEAMDECVQQSRPLREASDRVEKEIWPQKEKFISATSIGKKTKKQVGETADPLAAFRTAAQTMRDAVGKALRRAHGMSENLKQMSDKYEGNNENRIEDFKKRFDSADKQLQRAGGDLQSATIAMARAVDDKDRESFWRAQGQANAAIIELSSAIEEIKLAVAETGRRLNMSSRDIRIAKHIAKDFSQKKAELQEKYPGVDVSNIDALVEKIAKELVATEFVKRADPVGHVMATRVMQAYRQESTGEAHLPPTISEVLEKTETLEDYFIKVGQRSLMSRIMFTGVNNSWDRLISCLPRNLIPLDCIGLLKAVVTPITLWLAVTELEEAVTPGQRAPTNKEMAERRWNIIGRATFRVFSFILPQVMKLAISLGLTGYAMYRKGLAEIVEASANEAPLNAIAAAGLRGLGAVAGAPSEGIGRPIINNQDFESSGTEIGDITNRETGIARDAPSYRHGSDESFHDENQIHNIGKRSADNYEMGYASFENDEAAALREFNEISKIKDKGERYKSLFEVAYPPQAGANLVSMERTLNDILDAHGEWRLRANHNVIIEMGKPDWRGKMIYETKRVPLLDVARGKYTELGYSMRLVSLGDNSRHTPALFNKTIHGAELDITTKFKNKLKDGLSAFHETRSKVFREKLVEERIRVSLDGFKEKYHEVKEVISGKRSLGTLRYFKSNQIYTVLDLKVHGVVAIQRDNKDYILIDIYNNKDLIHSFGREGSSEGNIALKDMLAPKLGLRQYAKLSESDDNPFTTDPAHRSFNPIGTTVMSSAVGPHLRKLFGDERKDYVSFLNVENFGSIEDASKNTANAQVSHSADDIEFLLTTAGEVWARDLVQPIRIEVARGGAVLGHIPHPYAQIASSALTISAGGLKMIEGALGDDPEAAQELYQAALLDIALTTVTSTTKAGEWTDTGGRILGRNRLGNVVREQGAKFPVGARRAGNWAKEAGKSVFDNIVTDKLARDNPLDTYEDIIAPHKPESEEVPEIPGKESQFPLISWKEKSDVSHNIGKFPDEKKFDRVAPPSGTFANLNKENIDVDKVADEIFKGFEKLEGHERDRIFLFHEMREIENMGGDDNVRKILNKILIKTVRWSEEPAKTALMNMKGDLKSCRNAYNWFRSHLDELADYMRKSL